MSRWRLAVWGNVAALVFLPVVALKLADGSPWVPGHFIFAALLVVIAGGAFEAAARVPARRAYVAGALLAAVAALLLLWINLAVGIIGNEENVANLLYAGVVAVLVAGSLVARFESGGMARALVATAIAQASVSVVALVAGFGFTGPITVFFVSLWLIAAWLFHRSAEAKIMAAVPPSRS